MKRTLRAATAIFLAMTIITGVAYPLAVMLVSQAVFSRQANGSLIEHDGKGIGSELIGQTFSSPEYFWSRPSAAGYNGAASTGSNYGPTNPSQLDAVKQRVADLRAAQDDHETPIPIDLVTASGSGLDPHISPAAAAYQIPRVARVRQMDEDKVRALVTVHTEGRTLGVLGEPRVNVLALNLALDAAVDGNAKSADPGNPAGAETDAATLYPRRFVAGRDPAGEW